VVGPSAQLLFTDFRYMEQASREAPLFQIQRHNNKLMPDMAAWLVENGGARIGYEPARLNLADYWKMIEVLPQERLVDGESLVERARFVKEPEEIDRIARAAAINDLVWAGFAKEIKAGVAERDLALELDYLLRREGADGTAFPTIVASGPRGALPHGMPSSKKLNPGELAVFDFGARLDGYASDMTRTVALGDPGEKARGIYRVVAEAQAMALAALRPGLAMAALDAVARNHIRDAGYGEYFGHGLGHSVGIEIHEEPRLSPGGEGTLAAGMVLTVEPGVYLPGFGGVRIEDLVVIVEDGVNTLTHSPKELLIL
jgi:Xaa-Pro aminopeptidase